ncbi:MAG: hypothetical protein ACK46X_00320 [Candidatus Sericytochromatia bacterium]
MRARLFATILAVPLLAASLAGCDAAGTLLVPGDLASGGGGSNTGGGGLAITRFDSNPSETQVAPLETRRLSVEANRTGVAYTWNATGGSLSSYSGSASTWTAPQAAGTYRVDVTARMGSDEAKASFRFTVK